MAITNALPDVDNMKSLDIRKELESFGVVCCNEPRHKLVTRLKLCRSGKSNLVITESYKRKSYIDRPVIEPVSHKRTCLDFSISTSKTIEHVPHEVLRKHLFRENRSPKNMSWVDIVNLSRTNKYLREDAIYILRQDATMYFGKGSNERTIFLYNHLNRLWHSGFYYSKKEFLKVCRKQLCLTQKVVDEEYNSMIIANEKWYTFIRAIIVIAQNLYGSIDGVKEEYLRRKQLHILKTIEVKHIRDDAPARFCKLQTILTKYKLPQDTFTLLPKESDSDCYGLSSLVPNDVYGEILCLMGVFDLELCRKFVFDASVTESKVDKSFVVSYPLTYYTKLADLVRANKYRIKFITWQHKVNLLFQSFGFFFYEAVFTKRICCNINLSEQEAQTMTKNVFMHLEFSSYDTFVFLWPENNWKAEPITLRIPRWVNNDLHLYIKIGLKHRGITDKDVIFYHGETGMPLSGQNLSSDQWIVIGRLLQT